MAPRIVIIGGGSYQWVPKLLVDVANTPSLHDAEIVLEDIDPAPLPRMVEWVERIADAPRHRPVRDLHHRPAARPRRGGLRGRLDLDRWVRQHAPRPRDPAALRHPPERGRLGRARWDLAVVAQHPGARRSGPRHGGDLPRGLAPEPHEPDDDAVPSRHPRNTNQDDRALPRAHDDAVRAVAAARHRLPGAPAWWSPV